MSFIGHFPYYRKERVELGTSLYNLNHEMLRQSDAVEKYEKEMHKMREKREKIEEKTKELREFLQEIRDKCQKEEERGETYGKVNCCDFDLTVTYSSFFNIELELRESVKTLDYTEHVVRQAAEKYEGQLKIRQLIGEKLEKMRAKAEAEKRDQDFYIDKVLTHVQHMEIINSGIKRQIQAHQEEQAQLSVYINEATYDNLQNICVIYVNEYSVAERRLRRCRLKSSSCSGHGTTPF